MKQIVATAFCISAMACTEGEPPLDLLVVSTLTGEVTEAWKAPPLTFDVAIDDTTGRVWAVAEHGGPRVWELFANKSPIERARIPSYSDFPFPIGGDYWYDRGAIALDLAARRGAFTSGQSDTLVILDLDSGGLVSQQVTQWGWHSTAFDIAGGVGYATGAQMAYSFRTSDGDPILDNICGARGGTNSLTFSEATRTLFVYAIGLPFVEDICSYNVDDGPATAVYRPFRCGDVYPCFPAGLIVSSSGTRLYFANTAFRAALPEEYDQRFPSLMIWDLVADTQKVVTDVAIPHGLALSPDDSTLFVSQYYCHRVSVFDAIEGTHLYDVPTDGIPWGMDLSADGSQLFVTQFHRQGRRNAGQFWDCPPLLRKPS